MTVVQPKHCPNLPSTGQNGELQREEQQELQDRKKIKKLATNEKQQGQ